MSSITVYVINNTIFVEDQFQRVAAERNLSFDTSQHRILEAFTEMLELHEGQIQDLAHLHERFAGDSGKKGKRKEKVRMLSGLGCPERRGRFVEEYVKLITETVAPNIAADAECDAVACQCFPCVRVNRPGEFSIGPHCDAQYGHALGNINFYLPLTPIWGTNSLFLESTPGKD